ncbi:MAG: 4Fe-4S dicluster domain-containing protein [Spirochaetia bacterium]|nr:4Fe-4S dicluster domain-containing protein [Spirochaetia bacterium]
MSKKIKEIVIISGKGGTGKTTVSSSFAYLSKGNAVLVDADVDGSNLNIIADGESVKSEQFYAGHQAKIDPVLCTSCSICENSCHYKAITHNDQGVFTVSPALCEGCKLCVMLCPSGAIDWNERLVGEIQQLDTRFGPLISSHLYPPGENSGKLVTEVRKWGRELAIKMDKELIIVDGPPGIGCPTIAAMTSSDALVFVVEASVSSLHDMKRIRKVAETFSIPSYVCINKSDINSEVTEEIISYIHESNMNFLGTIVYDEEIGRALGQRKSVSEDSYGGKAREELLSIFNTLIQAI